MIQSKDRAIVLFSGGQDSATCLAWALNNFAEVETVGFDYGQRHSVELQIRNEFLDNLSSACPDLAKNLREDHLLQLSSVAELGNTALTTNMEIKMQDNGLPNTFVPGRNLLFLTYTAALAYRRDTKNIVTGVCETDYSGYPDCRDDTIKSLQVALNLGMESKFNIHTPVMWIDKADTWELAYKEGGDVLVEAILEYTHTCYLGDRTKRHEWGYGCGDCPACEIRANGWAQWSARRK